MAGSHSILPKFEDLTAGIEVVIKAAGNVLDAKSERPHQVELLRQLNNAVTEQTPNAVQIKLGMLLWLQLAIRYREYRGKDPYSVWRDIRDPLLGKVLVQGWVSGDLVCHALEQRLQAYHSALGGRNNFLYLAEFKKFLTSHPGKERSKNVADLFVDKVVEDLELEYTAKPQQKEWVDRLLSRYPAPWFLHDEFDALYERYKKYYNRKGIIANALHDPVRNELVYFMCAANKRLGKEYNPNTREDSAYRVKLAITIFVMHEINKTYNFLPVDWSELHKLCSSISNLNGIDALNYDEQLDHFITLRKFLRDEIKQKTADELALDWAPLTAPSPFLRDVEQSLAKITAEIEVKKRSAPTPKPSRLEVVVATVKELPGAAQDALVPQASSLVFGKPLSVVGGAIGGAIAGPTGAFVGSKVGGGLASIVLPLAGTKQAVKNSLAPNAFEEADRRIKEASAADQKANPRYGEKREMVPRDTGNYNDIELRDALLALLPDKESAIRKSFDMQPAVKADPNKWNMVVYDNPAVGSAVVAVGVQAHGSQVVKARPTSSVTIEEVDDNEHALVPTVAPAAKGKPKQHSPHVALALTPPAPAAADRKKSNAKPQPSAATVEGRRHLPSSLSLG